MKKLAVIALFALTSTAWADVLGFRVSGGIFDYEVTGTIRDTGAEIDVKSNLGVKDDQEFTGFAYFEHPIPIIPNIRLGTTSLNLNGTGTVNVDFNGQNFPTGAVTSMDLSHTEIGLYYELIDTGFDLDLGINVKMFDGYVTLSETDGSPSTTHTLDEIIPMVYGAVRIPLFGTGFFLAGDLSYISYDGSTISDTLLRLGYESEFHFGVEVGVRNMQFDIENTTDNFYADVEVSGPYAAVYLYF